MHLKYVSNNNNKTKVNLTIRTKTNSIFLNRDKKQDKIKKTKNALNYKHQKVNYTQDTLYLHTVFRNYKIKLSLISSHILDNNSADKYWWMWINIKQRTFSLWNQ